MLGTRECLVLADQDVRRAAQTEAGAGGDTQRIQAHVLVGRRADVDVTLLRGHCTAGLEDRVGFTLEIGDCTHRGHSRGTGAGRDCAGGVQQVRIVHRLQIDGAGIRSHRAADDRVHRALEHLHRGADLDGVAYGAAHADGQRADVVVVLRCHVDVPVGVHIVGPCFNGLVGYQGHHGRTDGIAQRQVQAAGDHCLLRIVLRGHFDAAHIGQRFQRRVRGVRLDCVVVHQDGDFAVQGVAG